jgi:hypothetical protein
MLNDRYLKEVRRALFEHGVWGAEARTIVEQLADHHREGVAARLNAGEDLASAEKHSLEALGKPVAIAEAAAAELRGQSRLARHPWLVGGVGMFFAIMALLIGTWSLSGLRARIQAPVVNLSALTFGAQLMNWLPFVLGCGLLALRARRSTGSWKALIIAAAAIGLAASATGAHVTPALYEPGSVRFLIYPIQCYRMGSGMFTIYASGMLSFGMNLTAFLLGKLRPFAVEYHWFKHEISVFQMLVLEPFYASWSHGFDGATLFKMFVPALGVIGVRYLLPQIKSAEYSVES